MAELTVSNLGQGIFEIGDLIDMGGKLYVLTDVEASTLTIKKAPIWKRFIHWGVSFVGNVTEIFGKVVHHG